MTELVRKYWSPEYLRKAAALLEAASWQINTMYPHSVTRPCEQTLPAAIAMIAAALECIKRAQPSEDAQ